MRTTALLYSSRLFCTHSQPCLLTATLEKTYVVVHLGRRLRHFSISVEKDNAVGKNVAQSRSDLSEPTLSPAHISLISSSTSPSLPASVESTINVSPKQKDGSVAASASPISSFVDRLLAMWKERSGTAEVLQLKENVDAASLAFDQAATDVNRARRNLDESMKVWERTSGQHLQLLQRRESWTPDDAQEFANLVSKEVTSRNALESARKSLAQAEESLSKRQLEYMNCMRRRYHEEQLWQDQWRVLGTYGTWSLIVLNSCVFLSSQFFLRMRENARMKTIENLIRENSSHAKQEANSTVSVAIVDESDNGIKSNDVSLTSNASNEYDNNTKLRDGAEEKLENQSSKNVMEEIEIDQESQEKIPLDKQSGVFSGGKSKWIVQQGLPSKDKLRVLWDRVKSTTEQLISTARSRIQDEDLLLKSMSEIHIPSAAIGAAATGLVVILATAIIPSRKT